MKNRINKYATIKNFNSTIVVMLLLLSTTILYAQEIHKVNFTLKLRITDGDLKNSQITITRKGAPYHVIDPSKGAYVVDLPLGFEYELTYTKLGYVTKTVLFNSHVPENREKGVFAKQFCEVLLEKQPEGPQISAIQVIAKISYNKGIEDFDYEKDFAVKTNKTEDSEKDSPVKPKAKAPNLPHASAVKPLVKQSEIKPSPPSSKPSVKNKVEKIIQEDTRKITIVTFIIDSREYVYKKEEYGWGVFFYKDGKSITESTFRNETQ